MKAIIDSGGTKADWKIISGNKIVHTFTSGGIQPFVQSKSEIQSTLIQLIESHPSIQNVKEIYFYGSGCSAKQQQDYIKGLLMENISNCFIAVRGDLLGAAIACCGNKPGIVGILGTGSNSCCYDGTNITQNVPSLGFILGDEGSGATIGKELVKSYFYGEMPQDLKIGFSNLIPNGRLEVLDRVYKQANPNAYLASFARFAFENRSNIFIQKIVKSVFDSFVSNQIKKYSFSPNNPVHFVGSIASLWKKELEGVLNFHGFSLGNIVTKPIDALVQYHMNNEYQHD
jgi:glucosamine kinase